jgi:hypothetical protein
MRLLIGFCVLIVVSACAAGGGNYGKRAIDPLAAVVPIPAAQQSGVIGYVSSWGGPGTQTPAPGPTPLVLYDQQFLDPAESEYLLALVLTPRLPQPASVIWTSSNPAALPLTHQCPNCSVSIGSPVPTAPPNETFVKLGSIYGRSTITARATTPVAVTASLTAYRYPSLSFGCRFRYYPAFAFDPDRTISPNEPQTWTTADVYETAPQDTLHVLDLCYNSPLAVGTTTLWHVPHGGVLLPAVSLAQFTKICASAWRNAGTVFTPKYGSVLLLKTKEGRVVKAMLPIGPYEVSNSAGAFTY